MALPTPPSYITQSVIRLWFEEKLLPPLLCLRSAPPKILLSSLPRALRAAGCGLGERLLLSLQALMWVHIQGTEEGELHRHLSCQWNPFPQPGGHAVQRKEVEVTPPRPGQGRSATLPFLKVISDLN